MNLKKWISFGLIPLLFTGCMQTVQLNRRAIVQAVGVDLLENGSYRMTLQIYGSSGAKQEDTLQYTVVEETGATMTDILTQASVTQGKQLFLGNCKLLVLGFDTAREGADYALNFFNSNARINPSMTVAVAKDTAREILGENGKSPTFAAEEILERIQSAYEGGFSVRSQLRDIEDAVHSSHRAGALALLEITGKPQEPPEKSESESEKSSSGGDSSSSPEKAAEEMRLEIAGTGLFRGDRLDALLTPAATRGHAWTQNTMKSTSLSVADEKLGRVAASVNTIKAKIDAEVTGDLMVFSIRVKVVSTALETVLNSGDRLTDPDKEYAQALQERLIQQEIQQMLADTQRQGRDLLGLSLLVKQRFPDFYESHKDDWAETLRNSGYNVEVNCEIEHSGIDMIA